MTGKRLRATKRRKRRAKPIHLIRDRENQRKTSLMYLRPGSHLDEKNRKRKNGSRQTKCTAYYYCEFRFSVKVWTRPKNYRFEENYVGESAFIRIGSHSVTVHEWKEQPIRNRRDVPVSSCMHFDLRCYKLLHRAAIISNFSIFIRE